jgi:hypothetical protein
MYSLVGRLTTCYVRGDEAGREEEKEAGVVCQYMSQKIASQQKPLVTNSLTARIVDKSLW